MKHIDALRVSRLSGFIFCGAITLGRVVDIFLRYFTGYLVDQGIGQNGCMLAVVVLAICGLYLLLQYLSPYTRDRLEASFTGKLYSQLEDKILHSEQIEIDERNIGEFSTCFTSDVSGLFQYVQRMLQMLFPDIVSFAVCMAYLLHMKWMVGVVAFLSGMISIFLMTKLSKSMVSGLNDYQNQLKEINSLVSASFFNLEMVKVNQMEAGLADQYENSLKQLHRIKKKVALRQAFLSAPTTSLAFVTLLSIAFCGGYYVLQGQISVGQLLSAISLSDYIVSPIMRFENSLVQYRRSTVNLKNYSLFADMKKEKDSLSGVVSDSEYRIRDITFQYSDKSKVFEHLNMSFEIGNINYITGNNGTGKSTLMKLIGGVYEITDGEVHMPVKSNARAHIRECVSILPQESLLFSDTIRGNLLAGTPCDEEKLYQMCGMVGLHDEICKLEHGYDTVLQEKGEPLSGGQKKRITFIRSVMKEADVYLFDEPTVGVDPENSMRMMEYLRKLAAQHYVIVITHDPKIMDQYPGIVHDFNGGRKLHEIRSE